MYIFLNFSVAINVTERDCANQKYETQKYSEGKWHKQVSIEEPYNEGCSVVNDKGARTSTIKHCYCRGDLCNSSVRNELLNISILMSVIIIFIGKLLCID